MLKSIIRKRAALERLAISNVEFERLNTQLLERFKQLDLTKVKVIHVFLPIVEKKEPNTYLIIQWLQKEHPEIKIIVPKSNFENFTLSNHEYLGTENLVKNAYNILEPTQAESYTGNLDMVLIPLLGFDLLGNRVGYGKGFYDRFLTDHLQSKRVGISLFPAVDRIEDANAHDVKLQFCITPNQIYTF